MPHIFIPSADGDAPDSLDRSHGNLDLLCRIGGVASLILVFYSLATMVQIVVLGGPPTSAALAFDLLQHHRLIGLLRLDLPTVLVMPLYYLLFLGLFVALRNSDRANALISTLLAFVGVTLVLATPTALSLIPLSDKFAAATDDAARNQLLAAGEALLATDIWHAASAIVGAVFLQSGAVLISVVMLRGEVFSKATGWIGVVMHGFDLAHIIAGLFLPIAGVVLMAIAGPLYPVWLVMVGLRLLRLARSKPLRQQQL